MKAALCKELIGPDGILVGELPEPEPGPGEVVIEVAAAALNFFDTLVVRGKYQVKPELPFSPGAEVAGRVVRVGSGVADAAVGDRVNASVRFSGCRERTLARTEDLVPIPDGVSDAAASGVRVTYGTAMHALKDRAGLKPGETVAVLGAAGGAGLAAVEIAKIMGARVIAVASTAEKLALCKAHGADALLDYRGEDLREGLRTLTDGRGVDVVYDCVGGPHAEPAFRSTAWEGRYLVIGFAAGEIPRIPLNLPLLKGSSIVGVFWGAFAARHPDRNRAHIEQVLAWIVEGRLAPHVGAVYPLSETADAIRALDERRALGKVVVKP